jgi:hypothetical protein
VVIERKPIAKAPQKNENAKSDECGRARYEPEILAAIWTEGK